MNFKLKTFILSTVFINVLFLNILIASAQERQTGPKEKPLYCYEFLVGKKDRIVFTDIYSDIYKFCINSGSPLLPQITSPIDNFSIIAGSKKFIQDTVCLDVDNRIKDENTPGTHCGPKPAEEKEVATIDACSDKTDLKGCIAARLPTKIGVAGVAPVSGNLLQNLAKVVNSALGLLGLIFTTLLIYAGIQWIHYGGDSEGLKRASKRIKNAIIGLMITLSAYSISYYILNNLAN